MIPHPVKAHKGGEDAYLIKDMILCVCDGVGGWSKRGVDPGLMSKELAANIGKDYEEMVEDLPKYTRLRLTELLVGAVKK